MDALELAHHTLSSKTPSAHAIPRNTFNGCAVDISPYRNIQQTDSGGVSSSFSFEDASSFQSSWCKRTVVW
eukprot:8957226-Pyramimonas_sp.AAC.1